MIAPDPRNISGPEWRDSIRRLSQLQGMNSQLENMTLEYREQSRGRTVDQEADASTTGDWEKIQQICQDVVAEAIDGFVFTTRYLLEREVPYKYEGVPTALQGLVRMEGNIPYPMVNDKEAPGKVSEDKNEAAVPREDPHTQPPIAAETIARSGEGSQMQEPDRQNSSKMAPLSKKKTGSKKEKRAKENRTQNEYIRSYLNGILGSIDETVWIFSAPHSTKALALGTPPFLKCGKLPFW